MEEVREEIVKGIKRNDAGDEEEDDSDVEVDKERLEPRSDDDDT